MLLKRPVLVVPFLLPFVRLLSTVNLSGVLVSSELMAEFWENGVIFVDTESIEGFCPATTGAQAYY